MYKIKFLSTTRYPTGNEDLNTIIKKSIHGAMATDHTLSKKEIDQYLDQLSKGEETINRLTTCVLFTNGTQIAIASVICYYKDPDVPVLGQKFALEKMIEKGVFSRDERKQIWELFWDYSDKTKALKEGAHKEEISRIRKWDWFRRIGLR